MKFVFAVVMLALVLGAQSSAVLAPLSYTAVSGPALLHAAQPAILANPPAAISIHESPAIIEARTIDESPAIIEAHAIPAFYSAPIAIAHEGTYVAKTRGAEHVAPLPGHLNSAASINLQPAPGTL